MGAKVKVVIAGLDPAIHPSLQKTFAKKMDARVKPAHDAFDKLFKLRPAAFAGTNGY